MANIQILPYAQQIAAIQRQRKLADLLQEQGMQPSATQMVSGIAIPTSPWETASKLAQSLAGAYAQSRSDKEEAEAKKQARDEYKQNIQDFISAIGPQKAYASTPVMEQSSDEDRTEMAPKMQWSDETGQMEPVQDWKETLKPGLSRNQAIARLLEMQGSENPYIAAAAPTLTGLLPKAAEEEYGTPFESGGKMYTMSKSGNVKALDLAAPTKESTYQRTTKEWSDKAGNKYKQDYAFNPTTKSMEPIGEAYFADVYHAPGASKDDDTKAGATLRSEYNNHPVVKQHAIVSATYENILNNEDTGAGDMALIYQYIKMLDPTTGVKEGEYASAENTTGIPTRVLVLYNKARTGEKLDPSQRSAFISQAGQLYETSKKQAETVKQGIEQIGKDTGVNPRLYPLPEPKRRTSKATEPPTGFVVEPQASQSNFSSPSGSLMFQFPSGR